MAAGDFLLDFFPRSTCPVGHVVSFDDSFRTVVRVIESVEI